MASLAGSPWRGRAGAVLRVLHRCTVRLFILLGMAAAVMLVLSFTSLPYRWHRWLGEAAGTCGAASPDVVLVLGGSGMPSGPELLRLQLAAQLAEAQPTSTVIVIHPLDSSVMALMVDELLLRGVAPERIEVVVEGRNTREQAMLLHERYPTLHHASMAVVSAPENCYRSVGAMRKVGFTKVCAAPAWDTPMFVDLDHAHSTLGGRLLAPDLGRSQSLRYDFWNRLKLQVTCLREWAAIMYYGSNGWL